LAIKDKFEVFSQKKEEESWAWREERKSEKRKVCRKN
jgi:hypothetical protein